MGREDKVKCQCCGKMMVPQVIFSRGLYLGWFMRYGGGQPAGSCCPFCLREDWDNPQKSVHRSPNEKLALLLMILLGMAMLNETMVAIISFTDPGYTQLSTGYQWIIVLIGIATYWHFRKKKVD